MSNFIFELALGGDSVKRMVFPTGRGKKNLTTSNGAVVGVILVRDGFLRLDLDADIAQAVVDADFDDNPEGAY
jgi:hypothetical protein